MARIDDIERRLLNWARWKHGAGAGGLGFASINPAALLGEDRDNFKEARIPTSDCEGEETDQAVKALPTELCETVHVVYLLGGGMAQKAKRLHVSDSGLRARISAAHRQISAWLAAKVERKDRTKCGELESILWGSRN